MSGDFYATLGIACGLATLALLFVGGFTYSEGNPDLGAKLLVTGCATFVLAAGLLAMGAEMHHREQRRCAPAEAEGAK